jgi:hypothetical protein
MSSQYEMNGPPIPVDLDGDGDLEIILGYWNSSAAVADCYHHDGTSYSHFPITIASSTQLFYLGLGDVTGDRYPELIATTNYLPGDYKIYLLDIASGTVMPGWPFDLTSWPKGFPAVVDADNNNLQDICFATDFGELFAVSGTGVLLTDFPKMMITTSSSGVAAGDIDGDTFYELVAATWDGWVYAWDLPTPVLESNADWPMRGINARNTGVYGDLFPEHKTIPSGSPYYYFILFLCTTLIISIRKLMEY